MKRVAPELDCLMWTLVEEGNERAVDEFLARYPELESELTRRGSMVNGLKKMRTDTELQLAPPPFRPRGNVRPPTPRPVMYAVAGLVLAALGFASFTATYLLLPKPEPAKPAPLVHNPPPTKPTPFEHKQAPRVVQENSTNQPAPGDEQPLTAEPRWAKPTSIKLASAPMHSVLEVIGAQTGLNVVIAPGTPNPTISVEYEQLPAIEILKDLGKHHGFTAFDQGDGSVLVVPAVEGGKDTEGEETTELSAPAKNVRRVGG